jgi:tight adherence protein C
MDSVVLGSVLTGVAVFFLLMAIFEPWMETHVRLDAVRAAGLPRHRYERLVSTEAPLWERILAPLASRLARSSPAIASQVRERDIIRAGIDPRTLSPAEVYAAKLVLGVVPLAIGLALSTILPLALLVSLPAAWIGYVFPTEYLGWRGRQRQARLRRELPDFLALVRPLAPLDGLERAVSNVADALHRASGGANLLAAQVRSAVAAYGVGESLYDALRDVALATDLEELDELAGALGQARRVGKGIGEVLAEHERGLREAERNRLLGAASTVQPKLAAILAGIYLPEFVLLVVLPLFISTLGRL